MPLVIPTASQPPTATEPTTLVGYGDQKIGKSETVAKLPSLLHVDTHGGTRHFQTRRVEVSSLEQWRELCTALPNAWRVSPFQFLCIDVLDDLEEWALQDAEATYRRMPVGRNFGGVSILELDRGLGYGYLRDAFFKLVAPVWGCAMWHTIFLVHSRAKWIDATVGKEDANSDQLDLTGKVRKLMCNRVDAIGRWYKDPVVDPKRVAEFPNGQLKLSFQTKEKVICGLRARYLHNAIVAFSDPAKPEEWAKVWPHSWNRVPEVPRAPVAPAPAPKPAPAAVAPKPAAPVAAPALAAKPAAAPTPALPPTPPKP